MRALFLATLLLTIVASNVSEADVPRDPGLRLVQRIPMKGVEGRIDHLAADASRGRLYVAALGNDTIEVIDLEAARKVGRIEGLKKPTGLRVLSGSARIVAASGDDGKCRIYSKSLDLLGTVDGLDDADNVRVDPKSRQVYVGYGSGALAIIDPEKAILLGEIKLDGHPESFQLEAGGKRIFVNVPTAKHVAVVDRGKRVVTHRWSLEGAEANFPMALDEPHHRIYVGCRRPARLVVLDSDSGKVVARKKCCGDTDDLFLDNAKNRIYLSGGSGCISVFELVKGGGCNLIETIATPAGARTSLFLPETGRLYLAVPHRGKQGAEIQVFASRP